MKKGTYIFARHPDGSFYYPSKVDKATEKFVWYTDHDNKVIKVAKIHCKTQNLVAVENNPEKQWFPESNALGTQFIDPQGIVYCLVKYGDHMNLPRYRKMGVATDEDYRRLKLSLI